MRPSDPPHSERLMAQAVTLLCAGLMLWQGLIFCRAPLPVLLSMMPDDAFYYYQPASILARTGFSSFDGLHFTNGYQPLWLLMCVPVYWLFPEGGEVAVRFIQAMQLLLAIGAVGLLVSALVRAFGSVAAAAPAFFFVVKFGPAMMHGVEAALEMCVFGGLFLLAVRAPDSEPGRARLLGCGVLAGLLFLARTDMVFTTAGLAVAFLASEWRSILARGRAEAGARLACFLLPVVLLSGGYLAVNLATAGHLMPVSGAVKLFWSQTARARAGETLGSPALALLANLRVFDPFVLLGAAGPWALLSLSRARALSGHLPRGMSRLWPFFFGATGSFLFYALAFFDPCNRTEWYYGPHLFLACWTLAAAAHAAGSGLRAAGLRLATGAGGAQSLLRLAMVAAAALLICSRPIRGLDRRAHRAPRGWNHALYRGALWAREHLPAGATIASGNAGILGYFSGRRVVNTDGLANDHAYLENFIKRGRVLEYLSQWDYVLDAYPVAYRLERDLPAAREVVLPPDAGIRFRDGDVVRQLRLYQLR